MTNVVSITDFRNNISNYINKVIYNKDSILLKKRKSIVAEIIAYDRERRIEERNKLLSKLAGSWDKETTKFYLEYKREVAEENRKRKKKLIKILKGLK